MLIFRKYRLPPNSGLNWRQPDYQNHAVEGTTTEMSTDNDILDKIITDYGGFY
jgi:hypothetical protein